MCYLTLMLTLMQTAGQLLGRRYAGDYHAMHMVYLHSISNPNPCAVSRSAAHPLQLCNIIVGAGLALDVTQVVPAQKGLPAQHVQHQELGAVNCG